MLHTYTTTYESGVGLTFLNAPLPLHPTPGVIGMSHRYGSERTLLQALISLAAAAGIALLVPFAILLVGLPIALVARGLLEVLVWLSAAIG
jgi:hypothetical protein